MESGTAGMWTGTHMGSHFLQVEDYPVEPSHQPLLDLWVDLLLLRGASFFISPPPFFSPHISTLNISVWNFGMLVYLRNFYPLLLLLMLMQKFSQVWPLGNYEFGLCVLLCSFFQHWALLYFLIPQSIPGMWLALWYSKLSLSEMPASCLGTSVSCGFFTYYLASCCCIWGSREEWHKYLNPCHPHGRSRRSFWFQN